VTDLLAVRAAGLPAREFSPQGLIAVGLSKRWNSRSARVLDGAELVCAPGSATWISGDNGVGKTTLLRILAGLIVPDAGTITLDGCDPEAQRREYQSRAHFISAGNTGLYARLTARQHLRLWGRLGYVSGRSLEVRIPAAVAAFGLEDLCDRRVDRLSLGQRQRVRLAGALVLQPSLLLLDEPSSSLDEPGLSQLRLALAQPREQGTAVVWCSPARDRDTISFTNHLRIVDGRLEPE
jgi:ABC-type multidrug transport system ATPase subunit